METPETEMFDTTHQIKNKKLRSRHTLRIVIKQLRERRIQIIEEEKAGKAQEQMVQIQKTAEEAQIPTQEIDSQKRKTPQI